MPTTTYPSGRREYLHLSACDEQACHGQRNLRTLYAAARREIRVTVPRHLRENRRCLRELVLQQLET